MAYKSKDKYTRLQQYLRDLLRDIGLDFICDSVC